jgi:hypothetical protein
MAGFAPVCAAFQVPVITRLAVGKIPFYTAIPFLLTLASTMLGTILAYRSGMIVRNYVFDCR